VRVAFVGVRRSPADMPDGYWPTFVRYHLELPWYYARHAPIHVDLVHPEPISYHESFESGGSIACITETEYRDHTAYRYDVVVHWRRWFPEMYDHLSRNVVLSQDHSYGDDWKRPIARAFIDGELDGILVFPTWHRENIERELRGLVSESRLYEGMTLGVDTDVYSPGAKDPYHLLWASDPGRGLDGLINPFLRLWQKDRRFHLTVTYPDYVRPESLTRFEPFLRHPGVTHLRGVRNGPQLWELFNRSSFLPYSSNFLEPSSRCHRQAMAAGSVVLYPPDMGTPSRLIETGMTGIVEPIGIWPDVIDTMVKTGRWAEVGRNARQLALSESWAVQAQRFHRFFSKGNE
jgi:hypothetical protein